MAWTCQRVQAGAKCGHVNPNRLRKCERCLKLRRPRKQLTHRAVLGTMDYAAFIELNGGEHCGICGRPPSPTRRLDRDHSHRTGEPRGLLCWSCNRQLRTWATVEWLRAAANYLERSARVGYARGVSNPKGRL